MIAKQEELTQSLHPLNHTSEHNRYHTKSDESLHLTSDEPPSEEEDRTQSLPYKERRLATGKRAPRYALTTPYKERRLATAHEHHDMHLQPLAKEHECWPRTPQPSHSRGGPQRPTHAQTCPWSPRSLAVSRD